MSGSECKKTVTVKHNFYSSSSIFYLYCKYFQLMHTPLNLGRLDHGGCGRILGLGGLNFLSV
jgi:hypothetical protein